MPFFRKKNKKKEEQRASLQPEVQESQPEKEQEGEDEEIEAIEEETVRLEKADVKRIMPTPVMIPAVQAATDESLETDLALQGEEDEDEASDITQQMDIIPAADAIAAHVQAQIQEGLYDQKYFKDGQVQSGEAIITGFRYFFDPENEGRYKTGLFTIPATMSLEGREKTVFASLYGNLMTGKVAVDGTHRYFLAPDGHMAASELVEDNGEFYYYDAFGQEYRGWICLDGSMKYFDIETGKMARGITTIPAEVNNGSEAIMYFDENGAQRKGMIEIEGKTFCFDLWDGSMKQGLVYLSSEYGKPKTVYFDPDGAMVIGSVRINGRYMYFSRSGRMVANSTVKIGDNLYYYDQKGYRYHGPRYLKGKWKYFDDADGHMLTGMVTLQDEDAPDGQKVVYYNEDGDMLFGPQEIEGTWKCFDNYDGHMFTGLTFLSRDYGGPKTVYYDENGSMQYGPIEINGVWRYFDENGAMVRSALVNLDGDVYYYDENGQRKYGQACIDGSWKYFDTKTGIMLTGLQTLEEEGNKTVLYDMDGNMLYGLQEVDGHMKYFDDYDGHMTCGLVHLKDSHGQHSTLYFDENGNMVYGPRLINGKEMFFSNEGRMVTNTLVEYEDNTYYYDQNGYKFHGQAKINGAWKLFDLETGAMKTGLVHLSTAEEPAGERTSYYDENGDMVYGVKEIKGQIKCFDLGTGAMKTGFVHLSADYGQQKDVYFNEEGNMVFGQTKINGKTYIFDEDTGEKIKGPASIRSWVENSQGLSDAQMKNNALLIWQELEARGWSMEAAAGILTCQEAASRINPAFENEEGQGLFGQPMDENIQAWMEENDLDAHSGQGVMLRFIHEFDNNLHWNSSSEYPLTFKEYKTIEFKPAYAASAFGSNYLGWKPEKIDPLKRRAQIWYSFLKENSGKEAFVS